MNNYNELYPVLLECFDAVKAALDSGDFLSLNKFANKYNLQAVPREDGYYFESKNLIFEINAVESDEEIKIFLYTPEQHFILAISEDFVVKNENFLQLFIRFFCVGE